MKTINEIKQILRQQKPYLYEKYGVTEVGVFGSYIRNEHTAQSDLDILIEFEDPIKIGLLGLIGMEEYLSDLIGVEVDLTIKRDLNPRIGKNILKEALMV